MAVDIYTHNTGCDIVISSHTFAQRNLALQNGTNNVEAIVVLVVAKLHGRLRL